MKRTLALLGAALIFVLAAAPLAAADDDPPIDTATIGLVCSACTFDRIPPPELQVDDGTS